VRSLVIAALAIACVAPISVVTAQEASSRYTSMKSADCGRPKSRDPDSAAWTCPGVSGLLVAGSEGDVRQTISVGRTAAAARKEPAASTWFGPPNVANDTIEWRFPAGSDKPAAIIQRWTLIPSEQPRRSILVVTRLPPGPVCHVAYVDVARNPDANALARKGADELARGFDCRKEPQILGQHGDDIPVSRQ
jgi:hypothetical protein